MSDVIPKKCCIKYNPATLTLFYVVKASGKLHRRSIPVRTTNNVIDDDVINNLLNKSHHSKYLKAFNQDQIKKLLKMLNKENEELKFNLNEDKNTVDLGVDISSADLNKLDDNKLNQVKEVMNKSFEQNQVKPSDADWKYDIEVNFDEKVANKIESSGWDDDDDSDMEF